MLSHTRGLTWKSPIASRSTTSLTATRRWEFTRHPAGRWRTRTMNSSIKWSRSSTAVKRSRTTLKPWVSHKICQNRQALLSKSTNLSFKVFSRSKSLSTWWKLTINSRFVRSSWKTCTATSKCWTSNNLSSTWRASERKPWSSSRTCRQSLLRKSTSRWGYNTKSRSTHR